LSPSTVRQKEALETGSVKNKRVVCGSGSARAALLEKDHCCRALCESHAVRPDRNTRGVVNWLPSKTGRAYLRRMLEYCSAGRTGAYARWTWAGCERSTPLREARVRCRVDKWLRLGSFGRPSLCMGALSAYLG
jgi:hypothetical protein